MTTRYDSIVAGLGAMGSLTLHELAARGHRVLGIDRFAPPHTMGSTHGRSRIIREAYFEDPRYVPLVQRAYRKWAELEATSATTLFRQTGGLMLGLPDSVLVRGARLSAELHGLPHDVLSATEVVQRFPAFRPEPGMVGVWEPRAGILDPELAITTALAVATANGAEVHTNETLLGWEPDGDGVVVTTSAGVYAATSLVIAVGAWTRETVKELRLPLKVQRNVQFWFSPCRNDAQFSPDRFPVFISEGAAHGSWYGFPDTGDGLKVARHHHGPEVDPNTVDRSVSDEEVDGVRAIMKQFLPDANGPLRMSAVCLYTNAPDEHFVIGRHPQHPAVIVASPCSGHGFKFASAIGEALADMATGHESSADVSSFALERFSSG